MKHTERINKLRKYSVFVALICLLGICWEFGAKDSDLRIFISTPTIAFEYFLNNYNDLFQAATVTLIEALVGLVIATLFSFIVIIICLYVPKLMDFILPLMITSQIIPLITLAPLIALIFDIGLTAKIVMAALLCFFPIFVNFANGINLIPKSITELMDVYNISKTKRIIHFYFPLSLPSIMSGLKVSATFAVIGAIMAEFCGSKIGLGKNLFLASKRLNPELMINSLILSAILGGIFYITINIIESKIGKWYKQTNIEK